MNDLAFLTCGIMGIAAICVGFYFRVLPLEWCGGALFVLTLALATIREEA